MRAMVARMGTKRVRARTMTRMGIMAWTTINAMTWRRWQRQGEYDTATTTTVTTQGQ